ncbi:Uncharacterised protein [Mycobacteroides abscessus subsp. abscessus]|nr:Uncharacterised protein [Mycobacteroides abscessus subsp. abscessus]
MLFSVSIDVGQDAGCFGGDERIGVDLSVRMCQGDADLLAVVLKAVDLLNPVDRTQFLCTLGPHINDQAGAARLQLRERGVVLAGEAKHLASSEACARRRRGGLCVQRQRRKPVLERHHFVGVLGYLGRTLRCGRTQRAEIGGRQKRTRLPV